MRIRKAAATNFCLVLKSPQRRTGRGSSVNNNPASIISEDIKKSGYQDIRMPKQILGGLDNESSEIVCGGPD